MKRIASILLVLCACVSTIGDVASFAAEPAVAVIFGVAKFVVGTDSIEVSRVESLPSGLDLIPGDAGSAVGVTRLEVKVGDSFAISDRAHVGSVYKVLRIAGGSASIEETHWTAFPGTKETRSVRTMLVRTFDIAATDK